MTAVPDSAAAVQCLARAVAAVNEAATLRAYAATVNDRADRDDLDGDCRREVSRLLDRAADRLESHADDLRERAYDAQQLRRHRYDTTPLDPRDSDVQECLRCGLRYEAVDGHDCQALSLLDRLDGLGRQR